MESYQSSTSIDSSTGSHAEGVTSVRSAGRRHQFVRQHAERDLYHKPTYDWTEFAPAPRKNPWQFLKWIVQGVSSKKESDEALQQNLCDLARLITLLRTYQEHYGMPELGGPRDQEFVLQDICIDLYAGGTPIWSLEPVMKKVAEGLTGKQGVDFFFLPRKAFIFAHGSTCMFAWNRGFRISKLEAMEKVAVRLASFASNTHGTSNLPSRMPHASELRNALREESEGRPGDDDYTDLTKEEMADEILNLASDSEGLFFFLNSRDANKGNSSTSLESMAKGSATNTASLSIEFMARVSTTNDDTQARSGSLAVEETPEVDSFWEVEDTSKELFSRLATLQTINAIDRIDSDTKVLYPSWVIMLFRVASSAGACAIWFNGTWYDMAISGALAIVVALVGSSTFLSRHDRLIFEVIASFIVGLISGLIALNFPEKTCFGAMAIAGVLDILQGFRVVYSIIEIMSKHTVTGGADFLEGILFTGLIAYSLKFGQYAASSLMLEDPVDAFLECTNGINERWYFLFVPLAAFSWSGLFDPDYIDLPLMTFHGIFGYTVSWAINQAAFSGNFTNFLAAMCVTFSAGLVSRFTGRQALGNTVSGLYVLLPGAYLVDQVFANKMSGFLESIILRSIIIGLGCWTGTLLCSPTLFGTNRANLQQSGYVSTGSSRHTHRRKTAGQGAMLFF
jgi:uncharacterized membrane protein YjjP (DUF1212 family)